MIFNKKKIIASKFDNSVVLWVDGQGYSVHEGAFPPSHKLRVVFKSTKSRDIDLTKVDLEKITENFTGKGSREGEDPGVTFLKDCFIQYRIPKKKVSTQKNCSSPKRSPHKAPTSHRSPNGTPKEKYACFKSIRYVSFRVPSKGTIHLCSPHGAPTERDILFSEINFIYL
jgi:hypothetical protein